MLKRYYNSLDEIKLRQHSYFIFQELSGGVYFIEKDRFDSYQSEFVPVDEVLSNLNSDNKVTVFSARGIYANFDLDTVEH